ncbi:MAG TPA: enolase C-terminal domain-like protein, partial [Solirubrobacterales bacterium]|nr:enolase C-terminal domain-like protein [Solirubrobacterales bacterium]
MRLASVEVFPYALPFKEPYVTARGALRRREMVLLRVRDDDGVMGLGEAVPLSLRGGATLAEVVRELEGFGEHQEAGGLSAPAQCAVEIALMDLEGRRAGEKEAGMGKGDEGVRCNATLVAGPPREVAAEAERWAQDGFATFKLKLGAETAKPGDIGQVSRTREALGPEARIRVDANEAWD